MENALPNRKPLRLENYDYNTPGAYFITFCTHNRKNLLARIVGAIHKHSPNIPIWQRGFYDHVIRNRADYEMIAKYIDENPLRWELDKLYSEE